MATLDRLSREQCEKAFAAYLNSIRAGSAIENVPVFVRKGKLMDDGSFQLENVDEIPVPSIAVSCPKSTPHDLGYPICELHVMSLTSVDELNTADPPVPVGASVAAARFGFIAEKLDESNLPAVIAAVSKPVGTDNRVIKNFNVFGMYQTDDLGQETERHWIDHLVFEVHCVPSDDLDGDGQA